MTPQERQLVADLFARLEKLEGAPRDAQAVDTINEGLERAPNALYPLVQTVLVQDEALKRADARIRELEEQLGAGPQRAEQGGFLDNMRDSLLGRREPQGSVPSVGPGAGQSPWSRGQQPVPYQSPAYGAQRESGGGSFLGTAAAAAAGVVGGALLMQSFRGMFGGQQGQSHSAFDQAGGGAPWGSGASGSDLARDAGLGDVGRNTRNAAYDSDSTERFGLFDSAQSGGDDVEADDAGFDGGFDAGGGD